MIFLSLINNEQLGRMDTGVCALEDMNWQTAHPFNVAADELLKEPGLKDVFKVAVEKGYALVARSG